MVEKSSDRVARHTAPEIRDAIERRLELSLAGHAEQPDAIERRLDELDVEWDLERTLETVSSSLTLFGLVSGILGRRRWLLLPVAVQGFFLQHALQGWCPPLPLLRRMGFRTRAEIDKERYALKALRGDFDRIEGENGDRAALVRRAVQAVE